MGKCYEKFKFKKHVSHSCGDDAGTKFVLPKEEENQRGALRNESVRHEGVGGEAKRKSCEGGLHVRAASEDEKGARGEPSVTFQRPNETKYHQSVSYRKIWKRKFAGRDSG